MNYKMKKHESKIDIILTIIREALIFFLQKVIGDALSPCAPDSRYTVQLVVQTIYVCPC